ncbi:hypothetical protein [Leptospira noguchii]|uniref:hypothetical protein n=1 Tax=Leptospira noguchii TaxID=28182 RepID=UPI000AE4F993|nr:hypothetical protein [Leptospira noguchii]UOG60934.1 hypothetical protein MAL07_02315 [Leptospira noguchii]
MNSAKRFPELNASLPKGRSAGRVLGRSLPKKLGKTHAMLSQTKASRLYCRSEF